MSPHHTSRFLALTTHQPVLKIIIAFLDSAGVASLARTHSTLQDAAETSIWSSLSLNGCS